jgi:hypothetical protein
MLRIAARSITRATPVVRASTRTAPLFVRTLVSTSRGARGSHQSQPCSRTLFETAKKYSKEHEVVAYDDEAGTGVVSITDYAQASLGQVAFVELPAVGQEVKQEGMSFYLCTRESGCEHLAFRTNWNSREHEGRL